jgi:hypothetical protein
MTTTSNPPVMAFPKEPPSESVNPEMAHLDILKTSIKKVGITDRTNLTSNSLPGLEIRFLFHPGNLFPIF